MTDAVYLSPWDVDDVVDALNTIDDVLGDLGFDVDHPAVEALIKIQNLLGLNDHEEEDGEPF